MHHHTFNRARRRFVACLLTVWVLLLQGCAQGELEQFVADIKKFYLNGGFTNLSEPADPVSVGADALSKAIPLGPSADPSTREADQPSGSP